MKKIDPKLMRAIANTYFVEKQNQSQTSKITGVPQSSVSRLIQRVLSLNKSWDELAKLNDIELENVLYPIKPNTYASIPFEEIYELQTKNKKLSTKTALEKCYLNVDSGELTKYSFPQAYKMYREWLKKNHGVKRASFLPCNCGEILEIDYSGDSLTWRDHNGINHKARIFVAALMFSKYIFAYATEDEKTISWQKGIIACFNYIGGVTQVLSLDNAKALVKKPDNYAGIVNASIRDLCNYYGITPVPCKPYSPKQKADAEAAAKLFQYTIAPKLQVSNTPIIAKDLNELNQIILKAIDEFNHTPFTKDSTRSRFVDYCIEKPYLKPLPMMDYELGSWHVLTTDDRAFVKQDNMRYLVDYRYSNTRVYMHKGEYKVRFFTYDDFIPIGEYTTADILKAQNHCCYKKEYMSDGDAWLRMGLDGALEKFKLKGYDGEGIKLYLESIYATDLPQMAKIKQIEGLSNLIKKNNPALVNAACQQAQELNLNFNLLNIRQLVANKVKEQSSNTPKTPQNKTNFKELNKKGGVMTRGISSYEEGDKND